MNAGELAVRFSRLLYDALVRYDQIARTWAVSGEGVEPFGLDLTDPRAKDDQIIAELSTYPIVYRTRIHR